MVMTAEKDRGGRVPLHYAAYDDDAEQVHELLKQGQDANAQDKEGMTPLHAAAQGYAVESAKALLAAGAAVDVPDHYGRTPLGIATFNSAGRGDLIRLLRAAGADPWRPNRSGVSPVALARSIGSSDVAQFFADLPKEAPPRPPSTPESPAKKSGRKKKS